MRLLDRKKVRTDPFSVFGQATSRFRVLAAAKSPKMPDDIELWASV
jgi:predicted neutral ceramidase superfamily lipid hydrolase